MIYADLSRTISCHRALSTGGSYVSHSRLGLGADPGTLAGAKACRGRWTGGNCATISRPTRRGAHPSGFTTISAYRSAAAVRTHGDFAAPTVSVVPFRTVGRDPEAIHQRPEALYAGMGREYSMKGRRGLGRADQTTDGRRQPGRGRRGRDCWTMGGFGAKARLSAGDMGCLLLWLAAQPDGRRAHVATCSTTTPTLIQEMCEHIADYCNGADHAVY